MQLMKDNLSKKGEGDARRQASSGPGGGNFGQSIPTRYENYSRVSRTTCTVRPRWKRVIEGIQYPLAKDLLLRGW